MAEFTLEQAMKAQTALRAAAGLGEERFGPEQLVGMLSDEIRALRDRGSTDEAIAELLQFKAGINLDSAEIKSFYVDTSAFGHSGE